MFSRPCRSSWCQTSKPRFVKTWMALGFEMTKQWIDKGKLQWCWLRNGGAVLMLQEYRKRKSPI